MDWDKVTLDETREGNRVIINEEIYVPMKFKGRWHKDRGVKEKYLTLEPLSTIRVDWGRDNLLLEWVVNLN